MAVVKADGYGLGAVNVAKTLNSIGCKRFAVATADEAVELRTCGVEGEILILGYSPPSLERTLVDHDLTQAVVSAEHANAFKDKTLKVQLAIDTGMHRFGVDARDKKLCGGIIDRLSEKHSLTGLFTHLSCADDDLSKDITDRQVGLFESVCDLAKGKAIESFHCANSAAGVKGVNVGNVYRLGILLYGLFPSSEFKMPQGFRSVFSWFSEIAEIKNIRSSERIGYGNAFSAERDMRVAVVSTGYADGLDRRATGAKVFINGRVTKIVGKICMDVFFADVTDIENVAVGDRVEIVGDNVPLSDLSKRLSTIDYEIVSRIGKRVKRLWLPSV